MKKYLHTFSINITSHLEAAETARLLKMLIDIGINDANETVDGSDESEDANDVLKMKISDPILVKR